MLNLLYYLCVGEWLKSFPQCQHIWCIQEEINYTARRYDYDMNEGWNFPKRKTFLRCEKCGQLDVVTR